MASNHLTNNLYLDFKLADFVAAYQPNGVPYYSEQPATGSSGTNLLKIFGVWLSPSQMVDYSMQGKSLKDVLHYPNLTSGAAPGFGNCAVLGEDGAQMRLLALPEGSYTLSFWLAPTAPLTGSSLPNQLYFPPADPDRPSSIGFQLGGKYEFGLRFNPSNIDVYDISEKKASVLSASNPLATPSAKFHHVAITLDVPDSGAATVQLYINGTAFGTSFHPVDFGSDYTQANIYLSFYQKHKLAELKVYSAVLTAEEIATLYHDIVQIPGIADPLLANYDFEHSGDNLSFDNTVNTEIPAVASGLMNIQEDDGFYAFPFGRTNTLRIDFSKHTLNSRNQLTFSFWAKSDFSSSGQLLAIGDHFNLTMKASGSNLKLTLLAGSGNSITGTVSLSSIQSSGNPDWCLWAIVLDGTKKAANIYYWKTGASTFTTVTLSGKLPADLGIGGYGLGLNVLTLGKAWTGAIAQLQIWQIPLGKIQLRKLTPFATNGFLSSLPDAGSAPLAFVCQNGEGEKYIFNQPFPNNNPLQIISYVGSIGSDTTVTVEGIAYDANRFDPKTSGYHMVIRLLQSELVDGAAITAMSSSGWRSNVQQEEDFVSIYLITTGLGSQQVLPPTVQLSNVIGAKDQLQVELIYRNVNGQTGFLFASPLPVYSAYIETPLIASFDFSKTADGRTFEDNYDSGLTLFAPFYTPLDNDAQFNHIFPLSGSNSLSLDMSTAFLASKAALGFTFWTQLKASNFSTKAPPPPLLKINDDYSLSFTTTTDTLNILLQTPNTSGPASTITANVPLAAVQDVWVFWAISLSNGKVNIWYNAAASEDRTLQAASNISGTPGNNLSLAGNVLSIGAGWTAGFTNLTLWQQALSLAQATTLMSDGWYKFPVVSTNVPGILDVFYGNPQPADDKDISKGLSITAVLYATGKTVVHINADDTMVEPWLGLADCHLAFCFHQSDLQDSGSNLQLTSNPYWITRVLQVGDLVYLLLGLKVAQVGSFVDGNVAYASGNIALNKHHGFAVTLTNVLPVDSSRSVPVKLIYHQPNGGTGAAAPGLLPILQQFITTPLVGDFNFDNSKDQINFQSTNNNGLIATTTQTAPITQAGPFSFILPIDETVGDPAALQVSFRAVQIQDEGNYTLTFWTNSDLKEPLAVQLNEQLGFEISFTTGNISINAKTRVALPNDVFDAEEILSAIDFDWSSYREEWLFWGINMNLNQQQCSFFVQAEGQALQALKVFSFVDSRRSKHNLLLTSLNGNTLTIGQGWKGSLAKLSIWQPSLTPAQMTALSQAQQCDFPSLRPSTSAAPIKATLTNDSSFPSFLTGGYLYNTQYKDKNYLKINLLPSKVKDSPGFVVNTNFVAATFDPTTDDYLFALCFRNEALQDSGLNILLSFCDINGDGTDDSAKLTLLPRIDTGGTLWLYFICTEDITGGNHLNTNGAVVVLSNIVAADVASLDMLIVYKNINGLSGFLPPIPITVVKNAIPSDLVASFNFENTEDFTNFSDQQGNGLYAVSNEAMPTSTDSLLDTVITFDGSQSLSIDQKNIILSNQEDFTICFWVKMVLNTDQNILGWTLGENPMLSFYFGLNASKQEVVIGAGNNGQLALEGAMSAVGVAPNPEPQWVFVGFTNSRKKSALVWSTSLLPAPAIRYAEEANIISGRSALKGVLEGQNLMIAEGWRGELAALQLWQEKLSKSQMTQLMMAQLYGFYPTVIAEERPSISVSYNQLNNKALANGNNLLINITLGSVVIPAAKGSFNAGTFNPATDDYQFELRVAMGMLRNDGANVTMGRQAGWNGTPMDDTADAQVVYREHQDNTVSFYFINTGTLLKTAQLEFTLEGVIGNLTQDEIPFLLVYKNIGTGANVSGFLVSQVDVVTLVVDPLLTYFKFDQLQEGSTTVYLDDEGNDATATLVGSPVVSTKDDPLGPFVQLADADTISLDLSELVLDNPNQLTVDFWAKADFTDTTQGTILKFASALQIRMPTSTDNRIICQLANFSFSKVINKTTVLPKMQNAWTYWAIVFDGTTNTGSIYYKIYDNANLNTLTQLRTGKISSNGGTSITLPNISNQVLTLGESWTGALTRFRIWQTALDQTQIEQISNLDLALFDPVLPGAQPSPLRFTLEDLQSQEPAIYISNPGEGHQLEFNIYNCSAAPLYLPAGSPAKPTTVFSLSFRDGVLPETVNVTLGKAYIGNTQTPTAVFTLAQDGEDPNTFNIQNTGAKIQLVPESGAAETAIYSMTFILDGVVATIGAEGSRGTRVEMQYYQLSLTGTSADTYKLNGALLQHLNIINHQGQAAIPVKMGFIGTNTILNDGKSTNQLYLSIQNTGSTGIRFNGTTQPVSKLLLSFDEDQTWGLGTADEVNQIDIPRHKTYNDLLVFTDSLWDKILELVQGLLTSYPTGNIYKRINFYEAFYNLFQCLKQRFSAQTTNGVTTYTNHFYSDTDPKFGLLRTSDQVTDRVFRRTNITFSLTTTQATVADLLPVLLTRLQSQEVADELYRKFPTRTDAELRTSPENPSTQYLRDAMTAIQNTVLKAFIFNWEVNKNAQSVPTQWEITPNADLVLASQSSIIIPISRIISSAQNGLTNLYVDYTDIVGYWDGRLTATIEKSPLNTFRQNIGIGTATPLSQLHVRGDGLLLESDTLKEVGSTTEAMKLKMNPVVAAQGTAQYNAIQIEGRVQDSMGLLMPVGAILPYAGTHSQVPKGWLLCDGSPHNIADYPELSAIINKSFNKDMHGRTINSNPTQFVVPDLRGRFPIGTNTNLKRNDNYDLRLLGGTGGQEEHHLSINELPSHQHTGTTDNDGAHSHTNQKQTKFDNDDKDNEGYALGTGGLNANDEGTVGSTGSAHSHRFTTNSTGGDQAHNNMPPYLAINYIIKA
ncbi:MAG: LamG-like jellyroll fold domain-containing protein [Bacteroidota bacterium]